MKRFLIAFIVLVYTTAFGGEIPTEDIRFHIDVLCFPKFEGRLSGSSGGHEAGNYVAAEFKKLGLKPAVEGSYFQPFDIVVKKIGTNNWLRVSGQSLTLFEDYVPLTICPAGEASGEVVLAGDKAHPVVTPSPLGGEGRGEGGLSGEDIRGKIAVLRYDESAPEEWLASKIKESEDQGAIALLILKKDLYSDYTVWEELMPPKLHARWEKTLREDFAHFLSMKVTQKRNLTVPVTSKIPCLLVREDKYNPPPLNPLPRGEGRLEGVPSIPSPQIEKTITLSPEGRGMGEGRRIGEGGLPDEVSVKVDILQERIPARNVIGYLPGKGDHKDETAIIGAHYDHLGLDSKGRRFPGADDNASGVAAMLEVAKRLTEKGPLRRSVVFISFDGEEWGLAGARYYTDHPVSPLEKTALMINMDTIGRNEPDAIHFLGSLRSPDVRKAAGRIAEDIGIQLLDDIEFAFKYGSDHYPFYEKGIPAIDLTSSYHENFHRITDTPEKVNVGKVAKIADLVYRLALDVADSGIYFQKPLHVEVPFPGQ